MGIDLSVRLQWILKGGILMSIAAVSLIISQSSIIANEPYIAGAVTIDLVLTFPLTYFLFIRKTVIPNITTAPVFLISVLTASLVLPANDRVLLGTVIAYVVPAAELFVLGYLGYRIYRTRREFKSYSLAGLDTMERLRIAFVNEIKPAFVARAAAFEVGVFLLALVQWRRPKSPSANCEMFTYHRANGSVPLLAVLLFLLFAETIIVHILLEMWSPAAACIVTALSIYFAFQVFAHLKALMLRPILVTENELLLRCGILGDATIRLDHIHSADKMISQADDDTAVILTPLGQMSQPNVTIHLSTDTELNGIYGIAKPIKTVSFSVDEPEQFIAAVRKAISDL